MGQYSLQMLIQRTGDGGSPEKQEAGTSPMSPALKGFGPTKLRRPFHVKDAMSGQYLFCLSGWYRGKANLLVPIWDGKVFYFGSNYFHDEEKAYIG